MARRLKRSERKKAQEAAQSAQEAFNAERRALVDGGLKREDLIRLAEEIAAFPIHSANERLNAIKLLLSELDDSPKDGADMALSLQFQIAAEVYDEDDQSDEN